MRESSYMMHWLTLGILLLPSSSGAQVRVQGAQGDSLILTCPVTDCRPRVRLRATDTATTVVRIALDSLESADHTLLPVTWSIVDRAAGADTATVSPLVDALISMRATLPERGKYLGGISISSGRTRQHTRLIITRSNLGSPLELSGLASVRATGGNVRFWVSLRDTSGRGREIRSVEFDSLTRSAGGGKVQASFDRVAVGLGSKCARTRDTSTARRDTTGASVLRPPSGLTVPADESVRLALCVEGLEDAGEYTGLLRITPVNAPAVTRAMTIMVKDEWWVALLPISLGILLALVLRHFALYTRPRLRRTIELQGVQARLNAVTTDPSDADGAAAIATLRERIAAILYDVELDPATDVNAKVALVNRQVTLLRSWAATRRVVESIEPEQLRGQFRGTLARALSLVQRDAPADTELKENEAALEKIPGEVETAVKTWIRERGAEFAKEVNGYLVQAATQRQRDALRAIADEVTTAVKELDADPEDVRRRLDAARLTFVRLLAAEQKAAIDPTKPPLGADPAKWRVLAGELHQLLDKALETAASEEATQLFTRAYGGHIDERADALRVYGRNLQLTIDRDHNLTADEKTQHKAALAEPLKRLATVREQSASGQLRQAATVLSEIEGTIETVVSKLPAKGTAMSGGGAPTAAPAGALVIQPNAPSVPGALPKAFERDRLTGVTARRDLTRGERLFLAGGALVAILLGFKVLYTDNATWGGMTDWLTAFLWGLGVTQASGAAFEGFTAVTAKFAK